MYKALSTPAGRSGPDVGIAVQLGADQATMLCGEPDSRNAGWRRTITDIARTGKLLVGTGLLMAGADIDTSIRFVGQGPLRDVGLTESRWRKIEPQPEMQTAFESLASVAGDEGQDTSWPPRRALRLGIATLALARELQVAFNTRPPDTDQPERDPQVFVHNVSYSQKYNLGPARESLGKVAAAFLIGEAAQVGVTLNTSRLAGPDAPPEEIDRIVFTRMNGNHQSATILKLQNRQPYGNHVWAAGSSTSVRMQVHDGIVYPESVAITDVVDETEALAATLWAVNRQASSAP